VAHDAPPAAAPPAGPPSKVDAGAEEPCYRLDHPLNGYFDMSTLRTGSRVAAYRYALPDIQTTLPLGPNRSVHVRLSLALEFGDETGIAEVQRGKVAISNEFQSVLERFDPRLLLQTAGKLELKDALVRALNRRLRTAQLREVYLTNFVLQG
jgi:flagellar basal body-associated protein FliL